MAKNRKKPQKAAAPAPATAPKRESKRAAVMAEDRKRRQRRKRIETALIAAVPIIGVLVLIGIPIKGWVDERRMISEMTSGTCEFDERSDPGASGLHETSVSFQVDPPSGGVHLASAAPAGDYSSGQVPPDGQIVHSHEHGYITFWYKPEDTAMLDKLREIYREHPRDILIVPRASLPVPVAATMWKKRLLCDEFEQDSLQAFFDAYVNEGPEKVPH